MDAIWEVVLRKAWGRDASAFLLDVRFASDAPRIALSGPSGAGKTQTLRMIAGIARADAAMVRVAGRVLEDSTSRLRLSPQSRRLGYLSQDYALFPHLTVRQNIAFARRGGWLNPARDASDPVVERWIAALHLERVAGLHPHQVSGGQRQRTALARALASGPTALLLDEPFAALDRGLRERLRGELRELQAQLGLPLMLITHDDEDVRALDAEVVRLRRGRVVDGDGEPDDGGEEPMAMSSAVGGTGEHDDGRR